MKAKDDGLKVGIYVPSYRRPRTHVTERLLNRCTYVVRKSEEAVYRESGLEDVMAVPDAEIDCMSKTRHWIVDNAPEDIVVQLDDDIRQILYRMDDTVEIADRDTIDAEFERIAQIMSDLGIGYAGITVTAKPWNYTQEFQFTGLVGGIYWYNKAAFKAKIDLRADAKEDTDCVLQELLFNRVILMPKYIAMQAGIDTNAGGDNDNKNSGVIRDCNLYMKMKWGCYYDFDERKNTPAIRVKR